MTQTAELSRAPSAASARPHLLGRRIELRWTNPPASAFAGAGSQVGVRVVRRERTFPLGPEDGTVVYPDSGPVVDRLSDGGLAPLTWYYYTVFAFDGTDYHAGVGSEASALATDEYGLGERLYRMLPAVHQREDRPPRADELRELAPETLEALRVLPPELRGTGQLRRFLAAAGSTLGLMRSTAEALRQLHDVDQVPPEYLPLLAAFLDWRIDGTLPLYAQRNEARAAPRLYRTVGTVPSLRAIVTRYTGWQTQVAEYAQHIVRSNHPAQGNLFALRETAAGWRGADEAADLLGFGPGNTEATGTAGTPATLVGDVAEPFRLRPGMALTVAADGGLPVTMRFQQGDASSLTNATAVEVAAVMGRELPDLAVVARPDGRLELRSQTGGAGSALRVLPDETSLVTLDGAPRGRLATVATGPAAFRLFYPVADPLEPVDGRAIRRAVAGVPFARPPVPGEVGAGGPTPVQERPWLAAAPVARLWTKTFRQGRWGDSVEVFPDATTAAGEPAAAPLPPASAGAPPRVMLLWLEAPGTAAARLRHAVGMLDAPKPATLVGERSSPLPVPHRGLLVLRRDPGPPVGMQFARADFADASAPTAAEVANLVNARLGGSVVASVAPGGRLRLESIAANGDARLEIDLPMSTAATALGFGVGNHTAAGDWGDAIAWSPAQDIQPVPPGRLADLAAVADGSGVFLGYARHDGTAWQVRALRWNGTGWGSDEALSAGPLSSREVTLGRDETGRVWAVWARQGADDPGRWSLRRRVRDPGTGGWDTETEVTSVPASGAGDREPALQVSPGSQPRVFFRSDRAGGQDLWQLTIGGVPAAVTVGAAGDSWPAPVDAGDLWLLYRSDRSVAHGRVGGGQALDVGTLRRYAGTTSVVLTDLDRLRRLHAWDDLVAYTPNRPQGESAASPLGDDELYTRGTVGLYLIQTASGLLDQPMAERLRTVLRRFVPQNVRTIVRLAPVADIEHVYPAGADLGESFLDRHPDIDHLGPTDERAAVVLPGWAVLTSARPSTPPPADPRAGGVSANAADLTSLRWRSHARPPQ